MDGPLAGPSWMRGCPAALKSFSEGGNPAKRGGVISGPAGTVAPKATTPRRAVSQIHLFPEAKKGSAKLGVDIRRAEVGPKLALPANAL